LAYCSHLTSLHRLPIITLWEQKGLIVLEVSAKATKLDIDLGAFKRVQARDATRKIEIGKLYCCQFERRDVGWRHDGVGMAGRDRLHEIAREFRLPIISIEMLISFRRRLEKLVYRLAEAELPTRFGNGRIIGYGVKHEPGNNPVAFVIGDLAKSACNS